MRANRCDLSGLRKPSAKGFALAGNGLIGPDEPAPFELIEGNAGSGIIFVCDHASNRFPQALGRLGIPARYVDDHIAWDIGAAAVTRALRERFAADAVLANYSRLVIDLNRRPGDFTVIPPISDGVLIPGNLSLPQAVRDLRGDTFHKPYHAAIEALIGRRVNGDEADAVAAGAGAAARLPVFIGIHSFTPSFHRTPRPWHTGILWDRDPRLALPLLRALRRDRALCIGDNEPYSGRHPADYSIDTHAETRGMAHVGIEIRQDLIADAAGQAEWAGRLGDALEAILGDESLFAPLSAVNPIAA